MDHRTRIRRLEDKEDLIDAIKSVAGREPPGVRHFLNLLSQPDVLPYTIGYFDGANEFRHTCQIFAAPWDCVMQDEALNETVRTVWDGDEETRYADWCDPCRNAL
jgi:hypothetical protein